jgi:hypothetical protein
MSAEILRNRYSRCETCQDQSALPTAQLLGYVGQGDACLPPRLHAEAWRPSTARIPEINPLLTYGRAISMDKRCE